MASISIEPVSDASTTFDLILLPSICQPFVESLPKKPVSASILPLKLPSVAVSMPVLVTLKFGKFISIPSLSPRI